MREKSAMLWLIVDLGLSFHFYSLLLPFFVVCHAVVGGMGSPAQHNIQPTAKGLCSVHIPPPKKKRGGGEAEMRDGLSLFSCLGGREGLWRERVGVAATCIPARQEKYPWAQSR